MKTFKLISIGVLTDKENVFVDLRDGLIINKEDDQNNWLIDILTDYSALELFQKAAEKKQKLLIHAVITKKENDPAPFEVYVHSITPFQDCISILLEGTLKRNRKDYAEMLLDYLIAEGFSGEELSEEFKKLIKSKPQIFLEKNTNL